MGWLILGIVIFIIGIILCILFDDEVGTVVGTITIVIGLCFIIWNGISIIEAQSGVYEEYQYQYEKYVTICDDIINCGDSNMFENEELMKEIRNYNAEIYKSKNENFMNKYTHNQRFKELEYIEVDGLVIDTNENKSK